MSYIRGTYYTFRGGQMFVFGLGYVPQAVVDEFVVMRYAEMTPSVKVRAEKRAIKKYQGNLGCDSLSRKHGLKTVMKMRKEADV